MNHIGTLREQHLHAALKEWYREPGDLTEVSVGDFVVDLVRERGPEPNRAVIRERAHVGQGELIEIQTRGFSSMSRKLDSLLDHHTVRLVHPIAAEKWIQKIDDSGALVSRRKSPKRGSLADVCAELVSFPTLLSHPHFTLEVLLTQEEEVQAPDGSAWRRKGWRVVERRLIGVLERHVFDSPATLATLLPAELPKRFTTAHLASGLGRNRHLAQQVAFCLRETGSIEAAGRSRAGIEYRRL